jgi:MoaA/NifB/PqqE/SkfB family radical SAM enzyme
LRLRTISSQFVDLFLHPSHIKYSKNRKAYLPVFDQGEMPLPRHLLVAATFKCTAQCPHCYMLQQNRKLFREQTVMAENLFQQIMASPFTRNIRKISFCGGEALLHPSVFKWMDQAEQRSIPKITSITNGLSLQDDKIVENLLKQDNLNEFNISLDSITEEAYCRAKGIKKCDFEKICKQIERITDRFRGTQTTITGSFVTTSLNAEETHRIITFCESLGLQGLLLHAYHDITGSLNIQSHAHQNKEFMTISDQIMTRTDYQIDVRIKLPFGASRQMFFCGSLAYYLCIGANGFLAPCCHIPWDEKYGHFEHVEGNPINSLRIVALREKFVQAAAENNPELLPASCRFCTKRTKGGLSFVAKTKKWTRKPKKKN